MQSFRLADEQIELRLYRAQDAAELYRTVKANFEHLRTFLHWVNEDYTAADAKEFIARNQELAAHRKSAAYGIYNQGKLVGSVGFVGFNWISRAAEIGYWIAQDFEGQGIVTKCCKVLINHAFDELQMNRLEIRCATENKKSRAVPERLDFRLEGVLRQAVWRHTRFYDVAVYGLLAGEWRK